MLGFRSFGAGGEITRATNVTQLKTFDSAVVQPGEAAMIARGATYLCVSSSPTGSTWRPADNVWRVDDYGGPKTTTQIQLVIDDAAPLQGTVEIGPGVWSVTQGLRVPQRFFTLRGVGRRATLLRATSFAGDVITTFPTGFSQSPTSDTLTIADLGIDHATQGAPGLGGINIVNSARVIVERVDVRGMATYSARIGDESHYCTLRDCHLSSLSPVGVLLAGARSATIENCDIRGSAVGVLFRGTAQAGNTGCVITLGGIQGWDATDGAAVRFDSSLSKTFNALITGVRLECPNSTVGIQIDSQTDFVGLTTNHYVGMATLVEDAGKDTAFYQQGGQSPLQLLSTATGQRLASIRSGFGSPEGVQVGRRGDLWLRRDGTGGAEVVYIKTAEGGTTGWGTLTVGA